MPMITTKQYNKELEARGKGQALERKEWSGGMDGWGWVRSNKQKCRRRVQTNEIEKFWLQLERFNII